ncbi:MAG: hypothetical protein V4722_19895 [Bacteroidota bacterium]
MKFGYSTMLLPFFATPCFGQNVGFGTTSPAPNALATIQSIGEYATALKLRNPTSSVQFDMFMGGPANGNTFSMGTPGNMPVALYTNSVNRLFVTGGGNVGIGTDNPLAASVATIQTPGDGATALVLRNPTSSVQFNMFVGGPVNGNTFSMGTPGNMPFALYTNNANRLFIAGNGNVGIGTDNANSKLEVNGAVSLPIRTITVVNSFTQTLPITDNDYTILVEAAGFEGTLNLILPDPAPRKGRIYNIRANDLALINYGVPIVYIIYGQSTIQELQRYEYFGYPDIYSETLSCTVQSTGTKWVVIGKDYHRFRDKF